MIRLITRQQVQSLLTYEDTIRILQGAFIDISSGKAILPPRLRMDIPERLGRQLVMMAYVESCDGLGMKFMTRFELDPERHLNLFTANIILNDARKGGLLAMMDASYITEVRTAAGSAVATKYLAREDSATLAIIGTGVQGRSHLKAIPLVRQIQRVIAYDPVKENLDRFVHLAEKEFPQLEIKVVGSAREAVRGADIICTTSMSPTPVVEFAWLKAGTHVNAIGAATPKTREIDSTTVAAAKVVLDSRVGVMSEGGDILIPIEEGIIKESHIYGEIGEICKGSKSGRTSPDEITLFKSVGSAAMDMATASVVYQRAVENNIGTLVENLQ